MQKLCSSSRSTRLRSAAGAAFADWTTFGATGGGLATGRVEDPVGPVGSFDGNVDAVGTRL